MKRPGLPHLSRTTSRGREYWYFRRRGYPLVRLPEPTDPGFLAAYAEARDGKPQRAAPGRTSIAALIDSYQSSPRWDRLAPRTRRDYDKVLGRIRQKAGRHDVSVITRPAVIAARDANRETPRLANYICSLYSILCEHAIDIGWMPRNPVKGIEHLPLTGPGYAPWPEADIARFRESATGRARLIFELCLGTGQRIGDVLRFRWADLDADGITLVQSKGRRAGKADETMWVPFAPALETYLATVRRDGLTIVAEAKHGRPVSYRAANQSFSDARIAAGLSEDRFAHGLRANRASELYEMGLTDAQVQAITGHKSAVMARKYGRGARQRKLAEAARGKGK
ncbi:site-specific integrase [Amaricoccus solimangrovi]|uniref:Integrase n=1 Tax=Amaricoccus solimangrovi TaxID=2589815 RepID=A0A501WTI9_9RHOB|nr:tyrosine-type recombinase/integrase [Amaricoccus solimangrovi]TPE53043.1 integrase [Amaricoccus solimangrovi]